ncbi:MAG: ferritin-like domain-containing protein [Gemmatimonadaceae bacterium]
MTAINLRDTASVYVRSAAAADRGAWSVERDIRWADIDHQRAHARPELLAALRDAALIESYHPLNLARLLRATLDDIDAGVVFSLELYEGFKHFHSLRRYLDVIGYEPAITDEELVAIRRKQTEMEIADEDVVPRLVEFMLSEHLAHYFFRRLGEQAEDDVLADLLSRIAADEVRHAQSASDLIAKRIAADPSLIPRVLDAALDFHHFGEQAIGSVPIAQPGDAIAIQTFAKRIERLCGVRLVDHIKTKTNLNRRAS